MTKTEECRDYFEEAFEVYRNNRMYPPNHERKNMITIKDRHIAAIARAESFMSQGITPSMSERHQQHVRKDIQALVEVRIALRLIITEPVLPFFVDPPIPKRKEGNNGDKSTLSTS